MATENRTRNGASPTQPGLAIMASASAADYVRDPTRWGSAEVAAWFTGFQHLDVRTSGTVIRLRHGGSGPPLLLVHGNPQNHVCWYKVAARLAEHYHVILPDLRGYGDSLLPAAGPDNSNFSFRAMAQDLIEVMDQLGCRNSSSPATIAARAPPLDCAWIIRNACCSRCA